MPDPTVDELFGPGAPGAPPIQPPSTPLEPTTNELFSTPQGGAAHDSVWSSPLNAGARILDAAGFGFNSAWGGRPLGLNPDDQSALQKAGIFNDYRDGHDSLIKSANEAIIRPAASIADLLWTGVPAIAGAVTEAGRQAAAELGGQEPGNQPTGTPEQAAISGAIVRGLTQGAVTPEALSGVAELASGVTKGYYPELAEEGAVGGALTTAAAREARVSDAAAARATGALGEGEAGYYDAAPLSPENAEARTTAAQQAGIEPPQPQPPPPDVHALARRIDPETFEQYDGLNAESALHRATLAELGAERATSPEAIAAQGEIDMIMGRVNNVPSRLTNVARGRLEAVQGRLDDILTTDTDEMAEVRGKLMDADFAMRDLAPDVSVAYRYAREIAPDLPETAVAAEGQAPRAAEEEKAGAAPQAAEMAAVSETEARTTAAAGAGAEPQAAEFRTPNVMGEQRGVESREAKAEEGAALAREQAAPEAATIEAGVEPAAAEANVPAPGRPGGLRAVEGTGETVTRGLAEGVEASAIERGLVNNFGDLPEYERVSMADQARQAVGLIGSDYELAKDVAMGRRAPPAGLLPESVFVGVEKRALQEGDVETLRQLATRSKLVTAATTMGQRIRSLGERDRSSPVGAIQAIQQAREAAFERRGASVEAATRATVEEIKAEARKAASGTDAWKSFLEQIQCSE